MRRNLPRDRSLSMEMLESRRLLTGLAQSQLFHYLLNEARHDPPAYQLASGAYAASVDQTLDKWILLRNVAADDGKY